MSETMTLRDFFERFPVSRENFRQTLNFSQSQMRRLLAGETTTADRCVEIYVATGGYVDANALCGLLDPKTQAAARQVRATLTPPAQLQADF